MTRRTPPAGVPAQRRPITDVQDVTTIETLSAANRMYGRLTEVEHFVTQTDVQLGHMKTDITETKKAVSEIKVSVSELSGLIRYSRNAVTLLIPIAMLAVGVITLSLRGC